MKTVDALFQQFGKKFVPLEIVAPEFFGVTEPATISRMAASRKFGSLKPFRARDSNNSPWLVDIENLAQALDERARG